VVVILQKSELFDNDRTCHMQGHTHAADVAVVLKSDR